MAVEVATPNAHLGIEGALFAGDVVSLSIHLSNVMNVTLRRRTGPIIGIYMETVAKEGQTGWYYKHFQLP